MTSSNMNWKGMTDGAIVLQLGRELKRMRLQADLSQAEVAARAGLDRTTVVKLEAGRAATLITVVQVLRAIGRLELLEPFHQEPQPAPHLLTEHQGKSLKRPRKRASRKKPAATP
jgi:transcriptional regulator with XRE-family HTH domain